MIHNVEFSGGPWDGTKKQYNFDPSICFIEVTTWGEHRQEHSYLISRDIDPEFKLQIVSIGSEAVLGPMFVEPVNCIARHVSSRSVE